MAIFAKVTENECDIARSWSWHDKSSSLRKLRKRLLNRTATLTLLLIIRYSCPNCVPALIGVGSVSKIAFRHTNCNCIDPLATVISILRCNVNRMEKNCVTLRNRLKRVKYEQMFKTEYCDEFQRITSRRLVTLLLSVTWTVVMSTSRTAVMSTALYRSISMLRILQYVYDVVVRAATQIVGTPNIPSKSADNDGSCVEGLN